MVGTARHAPAAHSPLRRGGSPDPPGTLFLIKIQRFGFRFLDFGFRLRHRIKAAGVPRAAFYEAAKGQKSAAKWAMRQDCLARVGRAAWMKTALAAQMRAQQDRIAVNQPKEKPSANYGEEHAASPPVHANHWAHFSGQTGNETYPEGGTCCGGRIRATCAGRGFAQRRPQRPESPRRRPYARVQAKKKEQSTGRPAPSFTADTNELLAAAQTLAPRKFLTAHRKRSICCGPWRAAASTRLGQISSPCGCGSRARFSFFAGKAGRYASLGFYWFVKIKVVRMNRKRWRMRLIIMQCYKSDKSSAGLHLKL